MTAALTCLCSVGKAHSGIGWDICIALFVAQDDTDAHDCRWRGDRNATWACIVRGRVDYEESTWRPGALSQMVAGGRNRKGSSTPVRSAGTLRGGACTTGDTVGGENESRYCSTRCQAERADTLNAVQVVIPASPPPAHQGFPMARAVPRVPHGRPALR